MRSARDLVSRAAWPCQLIVDSVMETDEVSQARSWARAQRGWPSWYTRESRPSHARRPAAYPVTSLVPSPRPHVSEELETTPRDAHGKAVSPQYITVAFCTAGSPPSAKRCEMRRCCAIGGFATRQRFCHQYTTVLSGELYTGDDTAGLVATIHVALLAQVRFALCVQHCQPSPHVRMSVPCAAIAFAVFASTHVVGGLRSITRMFFLKYQ